MNLIAQIREELLRWPGVYAKPNPGGGLKFMFGRRHLGHLHEQCVELPFPLAERDRLVREGDAEPHPTLPQSGWVSFRMRTAADVPPVLALFKRTYERALMRSGVPQTVRLRRSSSDHRAARPAGGSAVQTCRLPGPERLCSDAQPLSL
ncbi:MAG: DUF5519 family protein [Chloroflexi bacterium]|nr:DUF5519 family protein [Chloroflexota bacterium]